MKKVFDQIDQHGSFSGLNAKNDYYLAAHRFAYGSGMRSGRHWVVKLYTPDDINIASLCVHGTSHLNKGAFNTWAVDNGFEESQISGFKA